MRWCLRMGLKVFCAVMILVSGALWLCGFLGLIGSYLYDDAAPLRQTALTLLFVLAGVHLALDVWPMHWVAPLMNRCWGRVGAQASEEQD